MQQTVLNIQKTFIYNLLLYLLVFTNAVAYAAKWHIQPSFAVTETYTDNAFITAPGLKKGESVTGLNANILVEGKSRRIDSNVDYSFQKLINENNFRRDKVVQKLFANANTELIRSMFFFDARGSITQQVISQEGFLLLDDFTQNDNKTEVRTYTLNPYIKQRFGSFASTQLGYSWNRVTYQDITLPDANVEEFTAQIASGDRFERFDWEIEYLQERFDYSLVSEDTEENKKQRYDTIFESTNVNLGYLVSSHLSVQANVGYEDNQFQRATGLGPPRGTFWSMGFDWRPSRRNSIKIFAGRRFFGKTGLVTLTNRTRRTTWQIIYKEDFTTTARNQLEVPVVDESGTRVVDISNPSITKEVFLRKRLSANISLNKTFNQFQFEVFNEWKGFQSSNKKEHAYGSRIGWSSYIGPKTVSNIGSIWKRVTFSDVVREDTVWNVNWNVTYKIRPNITSSLDYSYLRRLYSESNIRGDEREDTVWNVNWSITQEIRPNMTSSIDYRYLRRLADEPKSNYHRNIITLTWGVTF